MTIFLIIRMNKQSLYLTLDHENGLVMGIGKSYQNSKRSSEISSRESSYT